MADNKLTKKDIIYLWACVGVSVLIVLFQAFTGLHTVAAFVSIAIVLMTMLLRKSTYTYIFAALATVDIIVGFYYSELTVDPAKLYNLIYNRISAVMSIWIAAILIVKFKQSREEERISNERMNALFLHATEGIIISNKDGKIIMVNPEAEKQFGYVAKELLGKSIEMLIPKRFTTLHEENKKALDANNEKKLGRGMELAGLRNDGSEFPALISLSSFHNDNELFVICFVLDTTELKQQREIAKALEKERELNEMKSRFVSMASHEFRTPLSTILSSLTLVEKYNEPSQKLDKARHINRIRASVKNLTNILNDFLSLDKLEEGLVRVNTSAFRLDKFCAEVMEEIRVVVKPGQQINYLYAATINEVNADQNLLRNIINNLLNNAIKYSPEKSYIDFSVSNIEGMIILTVKDRGIGIPDEEKPFMFDRFFRAKNASNIQGTGLGLNIVKRYVELMGGEIDFESEAEKGTTFTVKLPIGKEQLVA